MKVEHKAKEAADEAVITKFKSEAEEKSRLLHAKTCEIAQLKAFAEDKEVEIESGRKEADAIRRDNAKNIEFFEERLAAAEREIAQLKAEAEVKDVQIENAKKENSAMRLDHEKIIELYEERFAVAQKTHDLLKAAVEEANSKFENAQKGYDGLSVENAKLKGLYQETQDELKAVIEEKAEKERQLKKAKNEAEFLHIPIGDVIMTDLKLGDGGYGGDHVSNATPQRSNKRPHF